ncbi:HTH psq-type domain-containing protein [Aphis craccivora]|uniref:HTH psq-type domain-containing protein n=1 Tax=Aphis craccivora TaxID=307492 RepID=A0A6G0YHM1_APHCR|nr:HTH psq-type domain-containing protein [Aphis craccivora]
MKFNQLVVHFYRVIAKSYLDRKGIVNESFSKNLPGVDWAHSFNLGPKEDQKEHHVFLSLVTLDDLDTIVHLMGGLIALHLKTNSKLVFFYHIINNSLGENFPKNSTHLTQTLDVGYFRSLKQAWRNPLYEWKNQNTRLKAIPKVSFPTLVRKAIDAMYNYNGGDSIANDLQAFFKTTAAGAGIIVATFGVNKNEISDEEVEVSNLPILTNEYESEHEVIDDSMPEYQPPSNDIIETGTFILVNAKFGKHGMSIYVYLAVIKNIKDKIITVTGFKSMDTTKQTLNL